MKSAAFCFILFFTLLLFYGCGKYPRRGESVNRGEIIGNFEMPRCYTAATYTGNVCVIRAAGDLDTAEFAGCIPAAIDVDFNKVSVLGHTISYGCTAKIIRELKIDHLKKEYNYTVKFKDQGICKRLGMAYNLVLVPKIPEDYRVNFFVHED